MDTKLRKFNDNVLVKIIAFLMCTILFVTSIITFSSVVMEMERSGRSLYLDAMLGEFNYEESVELHQEFQSRVYTIKDLICDYKSEENIKEGKLLSRNSGDLNRALVELYYDGNYTVGHQRINATWSQANYMEEISSGEFSENENFRYDNSLESDPELMTRFIEANREQVDKIKAVFIKQQLREYEQIKADLDREEGFFYFATNGKDVVSNTQKQMTAAAFKKYPAYLVYEDGKLEKVPQSEGNQTAWVRSTDADLEEVLFSEYNDGLKVYMGYTQANLMEKQDKYMQLDGVREQMIISLLSGLGCILLAFYLLITTGRKDGEGKRKLYAMDHIWTEIQLFAIGMTLWSGVWAVWVAWAYQVTPYSGEGIVVIAICFVAAIIGLWFILSITRLFKAHTFIRFSLAYKLWHLIIHRMCGKVWRGIKEIYNGSSLMKKVILMSLVICLLSATIFLAPIVFLVIVVFAPKWIKKFEGIKEGVEEVRNGNLSYKIPVEGDGELDKLAKSINDISEASGMAVKNELKNQRMKTELISNVSHDLKTPLTSMVTYIDLLKTEGLDSKDAPEYLRILDEKTERLRHLTEDLFEAAKASSGAMPVQLEKVELLSLINQGLGEMDSKIQAAGLDFIINAEQEKYYVLADGQLLWRVVENLLSNVFKYALEKSRVYIDIKEIKTKNEVTTSIVTLEMKNISRNPLNISADELMERFKRGDESRTTEGSGLGLAIAKDLVKLQNGWFEVFVDGDLFKAQVMLTKYDSTKYGSPIDSSETV